MRWIYAPCVFLALTGTAHAQVSPQPGVDVQVVQASDGHYSVRARNSWWGPIQVQVSLAPGSQNAKANMNLPQRWIVPSRISQELFQVGNMDPAQPGAFRLDIKAVPGTPNARHRAEYPYAWPLPNDQGHIEQGFGGTSSHSDAENFYAIDIAADPGTTILAARGGMVMAVEDRFTQGGEDPSLKTKANYVRILQDDGSMAVYAHLLPHSLRVSPGQPVNAGQPLASVGQTGYASGPHLHFAVQVNAGLSLRSVPFKMRQPRGAALGLEPARSY